MKATSGLPAEPERDFSLADIFRAGDKAALLDDINSRDDEFILVIASDGEAARVSTLGAMSRMQVLGILALASETINEGEAYNEQ